MAFKLRGEFSLKDRGSSVLRAVGSNLRGLNGPAQQAGSSIRNLGSNYQRTGQIGERANRVMLAGITAFNRAGLAAINTIHGVRNAASSAANTVRGAFGTIFNLPNAIAAGTVGVLGKSIIDAVGFKEQQLTGLRGQLNSTTLSLKTYQWALRFASETPFETPGVLESSKLLLGYGFTLRQLPTLMRAAADAGAGLGKSQQDVQGLIRQIGQIKAQGFVQQGDVNEVSGFGIGFRAALQREFRMNDKEFSKLLSSGAIRADAAIGVLVREINSKFKGASKDQAFTISGLFSTLQSRPFELFQNLDADRELKPFKNVLNNLAAITDFENNPVGKKIKQRFVSGVGGLFQKAFGALATSSDPKTVGKVMDQVFEKFDRVGAWIAQNGPGIVSGAREVFAGIGDGIRIIGGGIGLLRQAGDTIGKFFGQVNTGGGGGFLRFVGSLIVLGPAVRVLSPLLSGAFSIIKFGFGILRSGLGLITRLGPVLFGIGRAVLTVGFTMARGFLVAIGPIGWVILAVGTIGTALVLAYQKVGWFRDGVNTAFAWVKKFVLISWTAIKIGVNGVVTWFGTIPDRIVGFFKGLPGRIGAFLGGIPGQLKGLGQNILSGLGLGGAASQGAIRTAGANMGKALKSGVGGELQVKSPSRVMHYLGRMAGVGLAQGGVAEVRRVARAGRALAGAMALGGAVAVPAFAGAGAPGGAGGASGAVAAAAGGARGGITVQVTVGDVIVGTGGSRAQGEAVQAEVSGAVERGILEAFERLNLELGGGA